ncbi:hypothetical protein LRH25_16985 [Ideonella azotifigens]|uniref:Uncharacterized protein n=1 Tax=Ideonella azotifigens TaxID=513160 RepID=A0ABP3UV30_9BURK|nr:hypothetical protein [Ideonella azotifigens]MCD2342037.1 hypothetical protein [Ideonella azotifigens]
MNTRNPAFSLPMDDHRGSRQHRFMESADLNSAFREVFTPLRTNIRRGMTLDGQLYAIEMDGCIPGQMLGTEWIPPATRGVDDAAMLADAPVRRALFRKLLAEQRPESLFVYVCEHGGGKAKPTLYVEIASEDGCYAAEYAIIDGTGWHRRELLHAPFRRLCAVPQS